MIKNSEQIVAELAALLKTFDLELRPYQTDVYIYLHDDGTASISEFVNIGGNSWLDDDHRVLYKDREHMETRFDSFQTIEDLCNAVDVSPEHVAASLGIYPDELEWYDVCEFIQSYEVYEDRLNTAYEDLLDNCCEYEQCANEIMYAFEMQLEEEKEDD